jgi:SAM-dependent methyltransferase
MFQNNFHCKFTPHKQYEFNEWDTYPFDIFNTNPNAYRTFLRYLKSVPFEISALEGDCINQLINKGLTKIKWLDVGAGLGDPILPVFELLKERGISVEYHYLEPSKRAHEIFRSDVESHSYQRMISSYNVATWEDYKSSESFDLITFFHSAYYIRNWSTESSNSLIRAVKYLSPGGFIYFSNLDKRAHYNQVVSNLETGLGIKKPPIAAEDITQLCAFLNLPNPIERNIDMYLKVKEIKDNNYSEYKDIVEFLTDKPFTEELSDFVSRMPNEMLFPISTISIGL